MGVRWDLAEKLPGAGIPGSQDATPASGRQQCAVGAEGDAHGGVLVFLRQSQNFAAIGDIANCGESIFSAIDDAAPVGAEGDGAGGAGVIADVSRPAEQLAPAGEVPEAH